MSKYYKERSPTYEIALYNGRAWMAHMAREPEFGTPFCYEPVESEDVSDAQAVAAMVRRVLAADIPKLSQADADVAKPGVIERAAKAKGKRGYRCWELEKTVAGKFRWSQYHRMGAYWVTTMPDFVPFKNPTTGPGALLTTEQVADELAAAIAAAVPGVARETAEYAKKRAEKAAAPKPPKPKRAIEPPPVASNEVLARAAGRLRKPERHPTEEELRAFACLFHGERDDGKVPEDYLRFLALTDGGVPILDEGFELRPRGWESGIDEFYSLVENAGKHNGLRESAELFHKEDGHGLSRNLLPIACDGVGHQFVLAIAGKDRGAVFGWHPEDLDQWLASEGGPPKRARVAASLGEFLDGLELRSEDED